MKVACVILFALVLVTLAGASALRRRFDLVYYWCPKASSGSNAASYTCPPSFPTNSKVCMCLGDFDLLNSVGNHYLAMNSPGTSQNWAAMKAHGNGWSYFVESIAGSFKDGTSGTVFANKLYDLATSYAKGYGTPFPQYFLVNEISPTGWRKDPKYRQFVIDLATTLKNRGVTPIVFAPFLFPTTINKVSWTALAKVAIVGVEAYLDSAKIAKIKNAKARYSYMLASYKKSLKAFAANGVPKNRVAMFEHYGNTDASQGAWGRHNVKDEATWVNIIKLRNKAFKELKLWGVGSYGWMANQMNIPWELRQKQYRAYNGGAKLLP